MSFVKEGVFLVGRTMEVKWPWTGNSLGTGHLKWSFIERTMVQLF